MSSPFIFGVCLNNPIVDDDFIVIKFFIFYQKKDGITLQLSKTI